MAEDLQCEAKGGEWPTSGVRRRHGGHDAQCLLARRLLYGDCEGMALGVVLHHRAARHQLGGGPRIQIWHPYMAYLLEREWPDLGEFGGADRTPSLHQEAGEQ